MLNRLHLAVVLVAAAVAWYEHSYLLTWQCTNRTAQRRSSAAAPERSSAQVPPSSSEQSSKRQEGRTQQQVTTCANFSAVAPVAGATRYLTYQPPGNGWNNQRQAMETALVLAHLLGRSLIVHPMSPHELGLSLKRPRPVESGQLVSLAGYEAYNAIAAADLTPPSRLLDLAHMARASGVPVAEWCGTQGALRRHLSALRWLEVCHSGGHGYWIDRVPRRDERDTADMLRRQQFQPVGGWASKCQAEALQRQERLWSEPLVRSVEDLAASTADVVHIAEGTAFGVDLRFVDRRAAAAMQRVLLDAVRPAASVRRRARRVAERLQPYNAVHVRRGDHQLRNADAALWLTAMAERGFLASNTSNLYVSTDERTKAWFQPFVKAGYTLTFAADVEDILQADRLPPAARQDITGVYEQAILIAARQFAPSPHSTFSAFVLRCRNETKYWDGMLTAGTRVKWAGHTVRSV